MNTILMTSHKWCFLPTSSTEIHQVGKCGCSSLKYFLNYHDLDEFFLTKRTAAELNLSTSFVDFSYDIPQKHGLLINQIIDTEPKWEIFGTQPKTKYLERKCKNKTKQNTAKRFYPSARLRVDVFLFYFLSILRRIFLDSPTF